MKFRVERDAFADGAAWVARSLPSRPPIPVLGGVLLEARSDGDGEALVVSGFDYEVSSRVEISASIGEADQRVANAHPVKAARMV